MQTKNTSCPELRLKRDFSILSGKRELAALKESQNIGVRSISCRFHADFKAGLLRLRRPASISFKTKKHDTLIHPLPCQKQNPLRFSASGRFSIMALHERYLRTGRPIIVHNGLLIGFGRAEPNWI